MRCSLGSGETASGKRGRRFDRVRAILASQLHAARNRASSELRPLQREIREPPVGDYVDPEPLQLTRAMRTAIRWCVWTSRIKLSRSPSGSGNPLPANEGFLGHCRETQRPPRHEIMPRPFQFDRVTGSAAEPARMRPRCRRGRDLICSSDYAARQIRSVQAA